MTAAAAAHNQNQAAYDQRQAAIRQASPAVDAATKAYVAAKKAVSTARNGLGQVGLPEAERKQKEALQALHRAKQQHQLGQQQQPPAKRQRTV